MSKVPRSKVSRLVLVVAAISIGVSQIGCAGGAAPVAAVLSKVIYWVGQKAGEAVVFIGVEKLIDRIFSQHASEAEMSVVVDAFDPLRGRCKGPVQLQNADDKSKTFLLVDFPVYRDSVNGKWNPDPSYVKQIESSLKGK